MANIKSFDPVNFACFRHWSISACAIGPIETSRFDLVVLGLPSFPLYEGPRTQEKKRIDLEKCQRWSVNLLAILQVSIDELLVGGVNKGAFSEAKAAIRLCYALPETRKRRYAMIDDRDIEQSIESASTYDREYLFYLL